LGKHSTAVDTWQGAVPKAARAVGPLLELAP